MSVHEFDRIAASEERFAPVGRGVELCYRTYGDPADETVLLVMGLAGPMIWWHEELCRMIAAEGFHVVVFDNRDVGRSSRVDAAAGQAMLVRAFLGRPVDPPYSLVDMADDAYGLLDHLGVERAHLVGVSMGGMIAQTMAVERPGRARSLASIMSTTGRRTVGWQHPKLLPTLLLSREGRDAYVANAGKVWALIGSPDYPDDPARIRWRAEETFDRGVSREGALRQMLAVVTQPDRTPRLRELRIPTLVMHGLRDPMVHISGGRATAEAIPGAELVLVPGMGHDIPIPLHRVFADAIVRTAGRAR